MMEKELERMGSFRETARHWKISGVEGVLWEVSD
jgi:hypothetical protein